MSKPAALLMTALFAALTATAYAQAPAAKDQSSDPVVQMRETDAAAKKVYKKKVAAAKKEREAEMAPMIESSVKEATAKGTDPLVAKREAEKKAKTATKKSYDAKVSAAKKERDAAMAASHNKAGMPK